MDEIRSIERAISWLEAQRNTSQASESLDIALAVLRDKLFELQVRSSDDRQQRKQVTVLFADVSNFTAMAELMDPEEVSGVIDDLWSRLDRAILDQGGRIDKHIGDAVWLVVEAQNGLVDFRNLLEQVDLIVKEWSVEDRHNRFGRVRGERSQPRAHPACKQDGLHQIVMLLDDRIARVG